jgi:hypothetical protein
MITIHNNQKISKWASLFLVLAIVSLAGPTTAQAMTIQKNMTDVADQMERWSKQCGTKPLSPEAQAKLSELLMETSKLLRQIVDNQDSAMQMEYHQEITKMKEEWNPFDTLYGN